MPFDEVRAMARDGHILNAKTLLLILLLERELGLPTL